MNNKTLLLKQLFTFLLFFLPSSVAASPEVVALLDSLRKRVQVTSGEEKINILAKLAWVSSRAGDYDQWEKECRLQQNHVALSIAYVARVKCVDKMYPDTDSVLMLAREVLPEINSVETNTAYNLVCVSMVTHLIYTGRIKEAQAQANTLLKEARQSDLPLAYALAYYAQGSIFVGLRQYDDAIEAFQKGWEHCPDYHHESHTTLPIYGRLAASLGEIYLQQGNYEKADLIFDKLDELLAYASEAGQEDVTGCFPLRCYSLRAISCLQQGEIADAEQLIYHCGSLMRPRISMRWYADFFKARYQLSIAKGDYLDAIADLEICMQNAHKYTADYYDFLERKAQLLSRLGRGKEGVQLLTQYINARDSLYHLDVAKQAYEIRTEYKVDDLSAEKSRVTWMLIFCLVACWALIVLTVKYIYHNRKLCAKNKILVDNLHKLDAIGGEKALSKWGAECKTAMGSDEEAASEEERRLYERIDEYLLQDNHFTELSVSRDSLASALGTNRTYIANAVKKCTELTVNEYVNLLRLEYARGLLLSQPDDSILTISENSGFGSVRNFNRLFAVKYGISPMEYRRGK